MNHRQIAALVIGLLVLLPAACRKVGENMNPEEEWAIYRLADPSLNGEEVRTMPLAELVPAAHPFISAHDLQWYHWRTHTFTCKPHLEGRIDSLARYEGSVRGVPFVVTVGKIPLYMGSFWWAYSSLMPFCPTIDITGCAGTNTSELRLTIAPPPLHQGKDPRYDTQIYRALQRAGVLIDRLPTP